MTSLNLPDKNRPVPGVRALQTWVRDAHRETGVGAERISWLVACTVVIAALQRALGEDGQPLFFVKGGVYIELNIGLRARATTDVDTLFRGDLDLFQRRLDETLAQPWGPFHLERTDIEIIGAPKLVHPRRFFVRLIAKGDVWRRIKVEVAFPEGAIAEQALTIPAPPIGFFGLEPPEALIGVAMDYQIAQKLHAASDPDDADYENRRVHDVLDVLLLKDRFYSGKPPASLKAACRDIFAFRADEAAQLGRPGRNWPPRFHINEFWRLAYQPLANALDIGLSLKEAVAAVEAWVREIDQADS
jgi:hypothetical protein